jgi:hypothetical protein
MPLPEGIENGERHFDVSRFPAVRGLAVATRTRDEALSYKPALSYEVFGDRQLSGAKESGHEVEGYVSVAGQRRSAFTGSIQIVSKDETGADRLYNFAVIHVRTRSK